MPPTVLVAILSTIGGALLGALLAEARLALQLRREGIGVLRRVLYVQLELWHGVLRSDPDEIVAGVAPLIARHFRVSLAEAEHHLGDAGPLRAFAAGAPTPMTPVSVTWLDLATL